MMIFKSPQSQEEFKQYYQLRYQVLRKPWEQPLGSEKAEDDESATHGMICNEQGLVIAVCRLHLNTPMEAQIRFMGVAEDYRGKGIGLMLLTEMEKMAVAQQARYIRLHARENAVPFYLKANYTIEKESYVLFNVIPHFEMIKTL